MFTTILYRMIMWELVKVFVISLLGITGILLMAGIIAEASQQGLGPAQIMAAIPLLIPSTLPYTIPATTLFATCVVYGRLSADNEVLAIKASGVNILHVVKPGVVLGLIMSLATLGLYYRIIPYTHHLLREMVFRDAEGMLYSILGRHGMISNPQLPYSMFVKGVQGKKLVNPVIKRKNQRGQIDMVAHAREADLRVDMANKLLLIRMKNGMLISEDGSRGYFEDKKFDVPLQGLGENPNRRPRDMTWVELMKRRDELGSEKDKVADEIAMHSATLLTGAHAADLPQHVNNLKERQRHIEGNDRQVYVEMLMRPALSFGCLCFILVGCPIGIMFSRGDYLGAFITCFLPIVIVYYPLMLCGTNLAKEGKLNEVALVFSADVVIAAGGLYLFRWLLRN
ncbi:MAG: LptF/LptG family permease [Gemmataceae bacterium]